MVWVFGIAVVISLGSIVFEIVHDSMAKRAVRAYCDRHGIEIIETQIHKNAYGVYFRCNGKRKYSRFTYYGKGKINWAKESPVEIIEKAGNV